MAYNLLKGKKGIIFGALNEMSIAWQVAEKCIEEGAEIVLTNTPLSIRMGDIQDFAAKHQIGCYERGGFDPSFSGIDDTFRWEGGFYLTFDRYVFECKKKTSL